MGKFERPTSDMNLINSPGFQTLSLLGDSTLETEHFTKVKVMELYNE